MEPLDLDAASVAAAISVDPARFEALIDGSVRVDAEQELRLSRYFRMSEGFFLRLQEPARTASGALCSRQRPEPDRASHHLTEKCPETRRCGAPGKVSRLAIRRSFGSRRHHGRRRAGPHTMIVV
jgi:plasmid maintenance system antidote protein VapI